MDVKQMLVEGNLDGVLSQRWIKTRQTQRNENPPIYRRECQSNVMFDCNGYGVVLVTAASQEEGEAIASALVELKLAACVTLLPVRSIYTWQGKVNSESEWQLIIKTNWSQFSAWSDKIQELHSYQVPEIIAFPIVAGSDSYLNWIGENVGDG